MITSRRAIVGVPAESGERLFVTMAVSNGGERDGAMALPFHPVALAGLSRGEIVDLVLARLNSLLDAHEQERKLRTSHKIFVVV